MKVKRFLLSIFVSIVSTSAFGWEATVTNILQHGSAAAIYLSPDPGTGKCDYGQPYILVVDDTPASKQRFSMILTAFTTGKKIAGYEDECNSSIWGKSRPTIRRLRFGSN